MKKKEEIPNLKSGLKVCTLPELPPPHQNIYPCTHPARAIKLELDKATIGVKETGNQPKLSAANPVSRSVSSIEELFEISRLARLISE